MQIIGIDIENIVLDQDGRIEILDVQLLDEIVGAVRDALAADGIDPTLDHNSGLCNPYCGWPD